MEDIAAALLREYPLTVQLLEKFAPAIFAFFAAVIASLIAYRQSMTAREQRQIAQDKLKLDFFEKRFAVYKATKTLLNTSTIQGQILPDDLQEFYKATNGAEFFFDDETRDYYMKIGDICWHASMARASQARHREGARLEKLIDEEDNLLSFLHSQSGKPLEDRFRKYLDLSKIGY
jgi:hypothetical protein